MENECLNYHLLNNSVPLTRMQFKADKATYLKKKLLNFGVFRGQISCDSYSTYKRENMRTQNWKTKTKIMSILFKNK
jgi:hypothetical protein